MPIKFDILNRFSGAVQFTAEIECADDAPTSIKIGLAVRWAVKSRANLSGADLSGADLSGADLSGADLSGADLSGDKIRRWIASAQRSDGHTFIAFETEESGVKVKAGCRWFTLAEYRAHIGKEYPGTDKAAETEAILGFLETRARQVGAIKTAEAA